MEPTAEESKLKLPTHQNLNQEITQHLESNKMLANEKALGALAAAASSIPGSVAVATITTPAAGIAGALGFTTTAAVTTLPVAIVIAAAAISYGLYKGVEAAKTNS